MADIKKHRAISNDVEIAISPADDELRSPDEKPTVPHHEKLDEAKQSEPLLSKEKHESAAMTGATMSPSKSEFSRLSIDEEKAQAQSSSLPPATIPLSKTARRQRTLDLTQRITALLLSIIILAIMIKAYVTYRANKNVTAGGVSIYPTFMQLWPTYLMITAGAVTVVLNGCVVAWRLRGGVKGVMREDMYNKLWDYILHGITWAVWLASSSSFGATKNMGPAADPNVLWGYTCSPTAAQINQEFPDTVRFYVECQVQTVSFWMSVSAVLMETFAVAAKVFVRQ